MGRCSFLALVSVSVLFCFRRLFVSCEIRLVRPLAVFLGVAFLSSSRARDRDTYVSADCSKMRRRASDTTMKQPQQGL